jgi:serine/threonine-protein kinase
MPAVGDTIDRYVIESVLGEGGMGRVYRALDPRLGRRVALKVLLTEGRSEQERAAAAARMLREARSVAAFSHPNVVAIHDVGEVDGNPFLAMEVVTGDTLRAYVGDPNLTNAHKLEWLIAVARGLGAAHRAGLVHRDIKPENVMVTTDGVVKILDFGIARRAEEPVSAEAAVATVPTHLPSLTGEGMMIGTPQYMAPEQLQGERVDGRADQFAWGVLAWELFVGTLPWGATKSGAQLVAAVLASVARREPQRRTHGERRGGPGARQDARRALRHHGGAPRRARREEASRPRAELERRRAPGDGPTRERTTTAARGGDRGDGRVASRDRSPPDDDGRRRGLESRDRPQASALSGFALGAASGDRRGRPGGEATPRARAANGGHRGRGRTRRRRGARVERRPACAHRPSRRIGRGTDPRVRRWSGRPG